MNTTLSKSSLLEELLAGLLNYGSWLASAIIGLGLAFASAHSGVGMQLASAGIVLFILLPTLRVLLMLVVFVRERDYPIAITAAGVLAIILLGFVIGIRTMSGGAG